MPADLSRILTTLNNAGISRSDPAIYQAISTLIQYTKESLDQLAAALNASSSGTSNIVNQGTFLTATNQASTFINSRELLAGTNISFNDAVANQRTVNVQIHPFLLMGA